MLTRRNFVRSAASVSAAIVVAVAWAAPAQAASSTLTANGRTFTLTRNTDNSLTFTAIAGAAGGDRFIVGSVDTDGTWEAVSYPHSATPLPYTSPVVPGPFLRMTCHARDTSTWVDSPTVAMSSIALSSGAGTPPPASSVPPYPAETRGSVTKANVGTAALRAHNGRTITTTVTQSGTHRPRPGVYRDVRFETNVVLDVDGQWDFEGCEFVGDVTPPDSSTQIGVLRTGGLPESAHVTMRYCLVSPQTPANTWNGWTGYNVEATACDFSGAVDDIEVYCTRYPYRNTRDIESQVVLDRCYMGAMRYESSPVDIGGAWNPRSHDSHNDCVQIEGTNNGVVRYCTMVAMADPDTSRDPLGYLTADLNGKPRDNQVNSCFQFRPNVSNLDGWEIYGCDLTGGIAAANFADDAPDRPVGPQSIHDNDFSDYQGAGIAVNGNPITRSNNVIRGTTTPVAEYR